MKSSAEESALKVAGAAVDAAVGLWAGPAAPIASRASGMLYSNLESRLERRRAERFVSECVDMVCTQVLNRLERNEFRDLPDYEVEASLLAVRDTFAPLDYSDYYKRRDNPLVAVDLDASRLHNYLQTSRSGVLKSAALSESGQVLYDYLLREVCHYIVQLVTSLPTFKEDAIVEILRRETRILDRLQELLQRLPVGRSIDDFATDYNRILVRKLDQTEIFGLTSAPQDLRYSLTTSYISLNAREANGHSAGTIPTIPASDELSIEQIVARRRRLLVVGDAGSGKTTLLRWLAVRCARREFSADLTEFSDYVPFVISLRRYSDGIYPSPDRFVHALAPEIASEMPPQWVHRVLRDGLGLVLVDGLDEVPNEHRKVALAWIESLAATFPDCNYVVTARPPALDDVWAERNEFGVADILEMTAHQVREYVRRWHKAVTDEAGETDHVEVDHDERSMMAAIESDRHVRLLAVNPLLCALLCTLNRRRHGKLPSERVEIYNAALDMLLKRRDEERGIRPEVRLSTADQIYILQVLALWLANQDWSMAPRDRVLGQLNRALMVLPQVKHTSEEVLQHLVERSGILREPVEGHIDFVHKTFQEYLAGKAAADNDEIGLVVRHSANPHWMNIVQMAVAHARPAQVDELFEGLLQRHDQSGSAASALVPISCLGYARTIERDLRARVEALAERFIPPSSSEMASALEPLGESAVEFIREALPLREEAVAPTIFCLSLIGGSNALATISEILAVKGVVDDSMLRPWPFFDTAEFAQAVFPKISGGAQLVISELELFGHLHHFLNVEKLTLKSESLATFRPCTAPPMLRKLTVSRRPRGELVGIEVFNGVEDLTINMIHTVSSLAPLQHLANLRVLRINVELPMKQTVSLLPLANLEKLGEVVISGKGKLSVADDLRDAVGVIVS